MLCQISAYSRTSVGVYFKNKNEEFNGEQEKTHLCEDGIEKSVPQDYNFAGTCVNLNKALSSI